MFIKITKYLSPISKENPSKIIPMQCNTGNLLLIILVISSKEFRHQKLATRSHFFLEADNEFVPVWPIHGQKTLEETFSLYVVDGLPHLQFPSGFQWNEVRVLSSWAFPRVWPIDIHLRRLTSLIIVYLPVSLQRVSLEIMLGQKTSRIIRSGL